jgi:hypothetical protein
MDRVFTRDRPGNNTRKPLKFRAHLATDLSSKLRVTTAKTSTCGDFFEYSN